MDNVADLPCEIDAEGTTAIFKLSPAERDRILDGGLIELHISGHPIPPVALNVTTANVKEEWQPDDLLCENCHAVWKKDRGFTDCNHCGGKLAPPKT